MVPSEYSLGRLPRRAGGFGCLALLAGLLPTLACHTDWKVKRPADAAVADDSELPDGEAGATGAASAADAGTAAEAMATGTSDAGAMRAPVPKGANVPALGTLTTGGGSRSNGRPGMPSTLTLTDDGFELGARQCNAAGACLTGALSP